MKNTSKNIVWHEGKLTQKQRDSLLQKGAVLWFTGLSGSGKSTVAREVERLLVLKKKNAYVLDGDNIRHGLNQDLGFSEGDRKENIRRLAEVTRLFCEANVITITAFISPFRKDRQKARSLNFKGRFFEIFCDTPLEICETRDPKGLYQKARAGEIKDFTGISSPYEAPKKPELVLKTGKESVKICAEKVLKFLKKKGII